MTHVVMSLAETSRTFVSAAESDEVPALQFCDRQRHHSSAALRIRSRTVRQAAQAVEGEALLHQRRRPGRGLALKVVSTKT